MFNNQHWKQVEEHWFVAFANNYSVNTPMMIKFNSDSKVDKRYAL